MQIPRPPIMKSWPILYIEPPVSKNFCGTTVLKWASKRKDCLRDTIICTVVSDANTYITRSKEYLCISLDYFLEKNFPPPSRIIYTKVLSSGKFSQDHTTITKEDTTFRQELIREVVHDSMMTICGGIADNSGLSSNANDLVNLLQMGL